MADATTAIIVEALKRSLAEPGEQRLFKSGKLAGLFPGRSGANADAALRALRDGLIETVRTETRGKTVVEWARATPRGVAFLHAHESPKAVLRELLDALRTAQTGAPLWLEGMRQQWDGFADRLGVQLQQYLRQLDVLKGRVEEALRRLDAAGPTLSDGVAQLVPWGLDALTYLEERHAGGAANGCPLPELFTRLRDRHDGLSITDFHDGLRRLHDNAAVKLLPFDRPPEELPEPEFALPDGAQVYYYADR
jgi:hypothetical protein